MSPHLRACFDVVYLVPLPFPEVPPYKEVHRAMHSDLQTVYAYNCQCIQLSACKHITILALCSPVTVSCDLSCDHWMIRKLLNSIAWTVQGSAGMSGCCYMQRSQPGVAAVVPCCHMAAAVLPKHVSRSHLSAHTARAASLACHSRLICPAGMPKLVGKSKHHVVFMTGQRVVLSTTALGVIAAGLGLPCAAHRSMWCIY